MKDKGPDTTEWSAEPSAAALSGEEEGSPWRERMGQYPMIVRTATPAVFGWMTERSGYTPLPDAIGLEVVGVTGTAGLVLLDGRTDTMAQIHVALDTPRAAARIRRAVFRLAFGHLGLRVLVTVLAASNTAAVRLANGMGFAVAGRIRDGFAVGDDLLLYELRREDCRFLEVH